MLSFLPPFFYLHLYLFLLPCKAVQSAHKAEEIVNSSHRMMKEEKAKCIATMEAFRVVEKKSQQLTTKLTEAERDKRSAEAILDGVER